MSARDLVPALWESAAVWGNLLPPREWTAEQDPGSPVRAHTAGAGTPGRPVGGGLWDCTGGGVSWSGQWGAASGWEGGTLRADLGQPSRRSVDLLAVFFQEVLVFPRASSSAPTGEPKGWLAWGVRSGGGDSLAWPHSVGPWWVAQLP